MTAQDITWLKNNGWRQRDPQGRELEAWTHDKMPDLISDGDGYVCGLGVGWTAEETVARHKNAYEASKLWQWSIMRLRGMAEAVDRVPALLCSETETTDLLFIVHREGAGFYCSRVHEGHELRGTGATPLDALNMRLAELGWLVIGDPVYTQLREKLAERKEARLSAAREQVRDVVRAWVNVNRVVLDTRTLEGLLAWADASGATVTIDGPGRATLTTNHGGDRSD